MITGELKNKIDNLWDIFASGGLVNPLEVIEQITYLMFIHDLDDSDNTRAKESAMLGLPYQSIFSEEVKIGERTIDGSQLKWSVFHDFPADRMYSVMQEWVFPFIKTLHSDKNSAYSKYMDDAIFKLPTPLVLSKVVDSLDEIYKMMNEIQTADVRGDVYEYLLEKIAQSGRNGQFRTPRHIIRMMVEMMDPSSDEVICDPACGTSGFLIAAGEYLKEKKKEEIFFDKQKKEHYMNHMFHGYDMDRTIREKLRNLMKYLPNSSIRYDTNFTDEVLSTEWNESELENDDLKNYKAKAEYYIRQHQDNIAIAKLKRNKPLTSTDIAMLEEVLWSEVGTKQDYEQEFGEKPLGEFVREIVGLDMNAAKEAFSEYLTNASLDSRQIYFVNQIVEYIVHNGMMKDLSVLQESPFTDRGSVVEIFTDLSVWMGIRKVIDMINANAVA